MFVLSWVRRITHNWLMFVVYLTGFVLSLWQFSADSLLGFTTTCAWVVLVVGYLLQAFIEDDTPLDSSVTFAIAIAGLVFILLSLPIVSGEAVVNGSAMFFGLYLVAASLFERRLTQARQRETGN